MGKVVIIPVYLIGVQWGGDQVYVQAIRILLLQPWNWFGIPVKGNSRQTFRGRPAYGGYGQEYFWQ